MNPRIRVLLADDHAATRADLRGTLEKNAGFVVCAEVADAAGAIDAALRERPDLCLLDIRMPGNGITAAWEITARLPKTKVVMLTVSRDDQDLFASLRAGASGYLLKDLDPRELPAALEAVAAGEAAMSPRMVARVLDEFRDRAAKRRSIVATGPGNQLTSREWEVLNLLRKGLSTVEIAERLFISQATVRSHIVSTLKKLRVPDRRSAIQLFKEE
jgi:DNA-binding NarL/FixJ family response regulator